MVGPPKTLQDLRRVEGAVRVTCRACRATTLHDREELITMRATHRQSCDWAIVRATMVCGECTSRDVRVDGVPFGENMDELRRHRARMLLMNLALTVLKDAAWQPRDVNAATPAVRLALRVLHPMVADAVLLTSYWREVARTDGELWEDARQPLRGIVDRLVERGFPVWAELR
jgi:hypothetical protein